MKLYLVVALVVLALVAFTEAQEVEPVAETDKIVQFGEQVSEIGQDIAKKTKAAFQNIQDSEFATTSRNWLNLQMERIKQKFEALSQ